MVVFAIGVAIVPKIIKVKGSPISSKDGLKRESIETVIIISNKTDEASVNICNTVIILFLASTNASKHKCTDEIDRNGAINIIS